MKDKLVELRDELFGESDMTKTDLLDVEQVRSLMRAYASQSSGWQAAQNLGIAQSYWNYAVNGGRDQRPGKKIVGKFELEPVVMYRVVRKNGKGKAA